MDSLLYFQYYSYYIVTVIKYELNTVKYIFATYRNIFAIV